MSGQTKFSQEASDNTYFRLDLSQVVEYDKLYPPDHNLETCDDNSIIVIESWEQYDIDMMHPLIPHDYSDSDENEEYSSNLLSNNISESVYNQVGATVGETIGSIYQMNIELTLESHEYWLTASTEGLQLLNEANVNKEGKDDFSFM